MDRTAVARIVSHVLHPFLVPVPLLAAVLVWNEVPAGPAAVWTAVILAPLLLPSLARMLWERRRGVRASWTVPDRTDRAPYYAVTAVAVTATAVGAAGRVPAVVLALLRTMAAVVLVAGVVNMKLKLSVHAGALAAVAAVVAAVRPVAGVLLLGAAVLAGWARLVEDRHTLPQVVAGIAVFGGVAALVFGSLYAV